MPTLLDVAKETIRVAIANPVGANMSSRYVLNGAPACLIGHALYNLGVVDHTTGWHPVNHRSMAAIIGDPSLRRYFEGRGLPIVPHALNTVEGRFLSWVQPLVDSGEPWLESCLTSTHYAVKTLAEEEATHLLGLLRYAH